MKKLLFFMLPIFMVSMIFAQAPMEFYGVTPSGGIGDVGGIFRTDEYGNVIRVTPLKKHGEKTSVNATPIEPIPGFIYGMTSLGGKYDQGVIYEYEIATEGFVIKHSFNAAETGKNPNGSLLKASNGKLYGLTKSGGSADKGILFEYDLSTRAVQKLFDFSGANGEEPCGSLVQSTDGMLYGMTSAGGLSAKGVIFRYDLVTGNFEKLVDFDGTNGSAPKGDLLEATNGMMYGFTFTGGTNNYGVMFSFDKATLAYTKLQDLTTATRYPTGSFIQASSGLLYGVSRTRFFKYNTATGVLDLFTCEGDGTPTETQYGEFYFTSKTASGAYSELGTVSKYSPFGSGNGSISVIAHFTQSTAQANFSAGTYPCNGMLLASDGIFYGVTVQGSGYHGGALYSFSGSAQSLRGKVMFDVQSPTGKSSSELVEVDKKLYGFGSGGKYNDGSIYRYDMITDSVEVMVDVKVFTGDIPYVNDIDISFVKHPNGKLYSCFYGAGLSAGFLMEYVPGAHTYSNIYDLGPAISTTAFKVRMIVGQDGLLYGVTNSGGTNNFGMLFSFDVSTNTFTNLHNWTAASEFPYNLNVTQAQNGKLYGITSGDVNGTPGFIYSYDIATQSYQQHLGLGTLGVSYPMGPFVEGPGGTLFASFEYGGGSDGTILEFDPATNTAQMRLNFENATTGTAPGKLTIGSNGKLYGLSGGQATRFFEFDPATSAFVTKHVFTAAEGISIGNFYGLAKICKLIPDTSVFEVAEICDGSAFTKTSSVTGPTMTYQWLKDGVAIPGETNAAISINVAASDSGYYYCKVDNGCRWIYGDSVQLVVLPLPTVIAGPDQHVCNDSVAVLNASGDAASYTWSGSAVDGDPFVVTSNQEYILSGTGLNGCVNTDTVHVFVTPTVHAGEDTTVCMLSPITLTASGDAVTYTWSDNVQDGVAFTAEQTHAYVLTGINAQGCVNTDTMVVTILQLPTVNAGTDQPVCIGSTTILTASGDAVTYAWSDNVTDGVDFVVDQTHAYVLTGVNAEGCINTDTVTVTALPLPIVNAGIDQHICNDSTTVFTASGNAITYVWSSGIINGTPVVITGNVQYILTGISMEGCVNTDVVEVFISPAVHAGQDTLVCMSSPATFNASGDAVSYTWSDNVTDGVAFLANATQTYVVTGTNAQGCINTDTLLLTVDNNCLVVWPGDTDNDFEVGTLDFFNVGLNFGATGDARNTITNDWLPQTVNVWSTTMTAGSGAGLNHAYADCNGDGTINYDDTLAVNQNFAQFHTLKPIDGQVANLDGYGSIFFSSPAQVYGANQLVTIDIHAGNSDQILEQVYGLGFDISYSAAGIVPGSLRIQLNNQSWVGEVSANAIRLGVDDSDGTAYLGLCRTDHANVSSYGVIGKVTFLTSGENGSVVLNVSNAMQINAAGVIRDLESEGYSVAIDPLLSVASHEKQLDCKVYPNPSKGIFNVSGLYPEVKYTIVLRDVTGKLLYESKIENQAQAQLDVDLSAGSYLVEIVGGGSVYREQVVVE